jgi:multidrug resistance efflux pump
VRVNLLEKMSTRVATAGAVEGEALAELTRARLQYEVEIEGVNTTVANIEAQLKLARYYLENTTLVAPEDGRIINLQVRPGMVSGIVRAGGIAARRGGSLLVGYLLSGESQIYAAGAARRGIA